MQILDFPQGKRLPVHQPQVLVGLEQAAIDEHLLPLVRDESLRAGNRAGGTDECEVHEKAFKFSYAVGDLLGVLFLNLLPEAMSAPGGYQPCQFHRDCRSSPACTKALSCARRCSKSS